MNITIEKTTASSHELGIPKMPIQQWSTIYDLHTGLKSGTVFPNLNKPFYRRGTGNGK